MATLLALGASLGACAPTGGEGPSAGSDRGTIPVTVTIPPEAYFVDRIGGDRVRVTVILPPGASPHTYEPSPRQLLGLEEARLYVEVGHPGFPFEARQGEERLPHRPELEVVRLTRGVDLLAAGGGETDPHVWLSPTVVASAAGRIEQALERLDPAGAGVYRGNLERFRQEVADLDHRIRTTLSGLPSRRIFVYHPAWGYFARDYGLVQVAIESGGKEPSAPHLVELIDQARIEGVRELFVERGFSDRPARVLAREIGAHVVALDPLAYDWPAELERTAEAFREALSQQRPSAAAPSGDRHD